MLLSDFISCKLLFKFLNNNFIIMKESKHVTGLANIISKYLVIINFFLYISIFDTDLRILI